MQHNVMTTEILERETQLDDLLQEIYHVDKQIDLVAILNERGKLVDMISRDDGITKDLSSQKKEMLFMGFALQASMNKDYDDEFGRTSVSILKRDRIYAFLFHTDKNQIIVVLTNPSVNPILQEKLIMIISHYKQNT